MFTCNEETFLGNTLKCPYCEIDLDSLNMTDGLKHILEHKKQKEN